ncbi:MAG: hypothetical protein QXL54_00510 [Candidatus Bathyarchaeia archaeon]
MRLFLKVFMDRQAITPVLSNLLLMVVAVAAMSIAATATYIITANLRETMGERLIIEDVWFNNVAGVNQISIYIRNTGKNALIISTVYINNTPQLSSKLKLEAGDHGWLNITYEWTPKSLHHINVVTSRGNRVEGYFKAP